jgi:CDGSH-type Zn-finger protein/uncharacterized Fe-S cluster protein YjdI
MIREEYRSLRLARPDFVAAHPAATNPALTEFAAGARVARITDPLARRLADLGNSVYGLMLHALAQVCAPAPLPSGLRTGLSDVSSELMRIAGTIGEACARLPVGPELPGVNAGLTFALPRSFGPLVQANAAQILAERAAELANPAATLAARVPLRGVAENLERLAAALGRLHQEYESRFTIAPDAGPAAVAAAAAAVADDVPAAGATGAADHNEASTDAITLRFDPARCIHSRQCVLNAPAVFLANVQGPWLHPEQDTVEHLVHVARSCPSGAITWRRHDGGAEESAPQVNVIIVRENGPYAVQAALQIDGRATLYRATLCRCGQSKNKPFCDNAHRETGFRASGEPASQPAEPLRERGGALRLTPLEDGPLHLRGPVEICSGTGRTVTRTTSARLCRCGASANKPFCDGSHRSIGFKS